MPVKTIRLAEVVPLLPLAIAQVDDQWQRLGSVVDGSPPRFDTRFRFTHTKDFLVLDIVAESNRLTTRFKQSNDPLYEDDVVEVFIGPAHSPSNYLELQASPAGVLFSAWITNHTDFSVEEPVRRLDICFDHPTGDRPQVQTLLDGKLPQSFTARQFRHGITVQEWRTRFEIPYSAFDEQCVVSLSQAEPQKSTAHRVFKANVFRIQHNDQGSDYQAWCPTGHVDFHRPANFAKLIAPPPI